MMKANLERMARRIMFAAGMGSCLSLACASAWSQELPPPAPDAAEGAADAAKAPIEGAKDAATDAAKAPAEGAKDAATDAAKAQAEGAKDATKTDPFAEPAADAAKGVRDAAGAAREGAPDAARDLKEGTRDATRDLREGAQDAARDAREGARDAREGARDAAGDLREGARDAARDAREGARDVREGARDATRDLREGARDARESFRDERDDLRDDVRRPRQDTDPRDDRSREPRDDRSREPRERTDSARSRGSFRESSRSSARSETRIRTENLRSADLGFWFGRSTGEGLVISDIATTGPMASLIADFGFRAGDQIVSVDGYRITREADFVRYLLADEVLHERVPVVVMRGGERMTLHVEPIRLVEQVQTVHVDPLEQFGVILDDRSADRVLVWRVVPRSPAFYAGIQPGDVITTFHGQRVTSPDAFAQFVERSEPGMISVEVNRNQRVRQLDLEMPAIEGAARTALRPEFDDPSIERFSERREERIEDRRDLRFDGDGYVVPRAAAPAAGPVRRALFPRLRGR
jgi:PDZ domain-containing protein